LPEEEVRHAEFAGGADEEIGIGQAGGVEIGGERFFGDAKRIERTGLASLGDELIDGVDQFGFAGVVNGQIQAEAGVRFGGADGGIEFFANGGGEVFQAADGVETNVVFLQRGQFLAEVDAEEAPERVDFGARALPVFDREGVEREGFEPERGRGFDGGADGLNARLMAGDARQQTATWAGRRCGSMARARARSGSLGPRLSRSAFISVIPQCTTASANPRTASI
jgi:hypothetical protein